MGDKSVAALGLTGLGAGVVHNIHKKQNADMLYHAVKQNFAYKDSILNLLSQEIGSLKLANRSASRMINTV